MRNKQETVTSPVVVRSDRPDFAARKARLEQELGPVIRIMDQEGITRHGFRITDATEVRLNRSARTFSMEIAEKLERARDMIREAAARETPGGLLGLPNAMIVHEHTYRQLCITLWDDHGVKDDHRVGEVWETPSSVRLVSMVDGVTQ